MADGRIDELRRRLERDPGSRLFAQLAEELRKAGDFEEAIGVARSGLALHPAYPSARLTLGRALLDSGDARAARVELEAAVKGAPDNILASRFLGEALENLGDLAGAVAQYRTTLQMAPGDQTLEARIQAMEASMKARRGGAAGPATTTPAAVAAEASPASAPAAVPPAVTHAEPDSGEGEEESGVLPPTIRIRAPGEPALPSRPVPRQPGTTVAGAAPAKPAGPEPAAARQAGPAAGGGAPAPGTETPRAGGVAPPDTPGARPGVETTVPPGGLEGVGSERGARPVPGAAEARGAGGAGGDAEEASDAAPTLPTAEAPVLEEEELAPTLPPQATSIVEGRAEGTAEREAARESAELVPTPPSATGASEVRASGAPGTKGEASAGSSPFSSVTLAELYFQQGLLERAAEVYRQVLADEPGNARARTRLDEVEALVAAGSAELPVPATRSGDERAARRRALERTIERLEGLLAVVRRR